MLKKSLIADILDARKFKVQSNDSQNSYFIVQSAVCDDHSKTTRCLMTRFQSAFINESQQLYFEEVYKKLSRLWDSTIFSVYGRSFTDNTLPSQESFHPILYSLKVPSKTLFDYMRTYKNTNNNNFQKICRGMAIRMAWGMKYLHNNNITHGLLSLSTVYVDRFDNAYITNYGFQQFLTFIDKTQSGIVYPYTTAPEIVNSVDAPIFTKENDVYSYGAIIYQLFTLTVLDEKVPFDYITACDQCQFIPEEIKNIIKQCCAIKPETRPSFDKIVEILTQGLEKDALFSIVEQIQGMNQMADNNDSNALNRLGDKYADGLGVKKDLITAAKYFQRAAALSDPLGQANYGQCLQDGEGVQQDLQLGLDYFRKSAEQGNMVGQYNYGMALFNGDGTKQNLELAAKFLYLSSNQGFVPAQVSYSICLNEGKGIQKDQHEAAKIMKKAAEAGNIDALCIYGQYLKNGEGVRKDEQSAAAYFKMAAEKDNVLAKIEYAKCLLKGKGVTKDVTQSVRLLKSIMKSDEKATYILGKIYYNGYLGIKDLNLARKYFSNAPNIIKSNLYLQKLGKENTSAHPIHKDSPGPRKQPRPHIELAPTPSPTLLLQQANPPNKESDQKIEQVSKQTNESSMKDPKENTTNQSAGILNNTNQQTGILNNTNQSAGILNTTNQSAGFLNTLAPKQQNPPAQISLPINQPSVNTPTPTASNELTIDLTPLSVPKYNSSMNDPFYNSSHDEIINAAYNGELDAVNRLGELFLNNPQDDPHCLKYDSRIAVQYFEMGTVCNHTPSIFNLANCYLTGDGTALNKATGMKLLTHCANKDYAKALALVSCIDYKTSANYISKNEINVALKKSLELELPESLYYQGHRINDIKMIKKAANKGYPPAIYELGMIYSKINFDIGKQFLKRAADFEDDNAQFELSKIMFKEGKNTEAVKYILLSLRQFNQNSLEYIKELLKTHKHIIDPFLTNTDKFLINSENGDPAVLNEIGERLAEGKDGLKRDIVRAIKYYEIAASKNNSEALNNLGVCIQEGTGLKQSSKKGANYIQQSAKLYCGAGLMNYGAILQFGEGIAPNEVEATKYYKMSAEKENPIGAINYGHALIKGIGVNKDPIAAAKMYQFAASKGEADGVYFYAKCLLYGRGVPVNTGEALRILKEKAVSGDSNCQYKYGQILTKGIGCQTNLQEGISWLRRAVIQRHEKAEIYLTQIDKNYHSLKTILNIASTENEPPSRKKKGRKKKRATSIVLDHISKSEKESQKQQKSSQSKPSSQENPTKEQKTPEPKQNVEPAGITEPPKPLTNSPNHQLSFDLISQKIKENYQKTPPIYVPPTSNPKQSEIFKPIIPNPNPLIPVTVNNVPKSPNPTTANVTQSQNAQLIQPQATSNAVPISNLLSPQHLSAIQSNSPAPQQNVSLTNQNLQTNMQNISTVSQNVTPNSQMLNSNQSPQRTTPIIHNLQPQQNTPQVPPQQQKFYPLSQLKELQNKDTPDSAQLPQTNVLNQPSNQAPQSTPENQTAKPPANDAPKPVVTDSNQKNECLLPSIEIKNVKTLPVDNIEQLANSSLKNAQVLYGKLLLNGIGFKKDEQLANIYFQLASDNPEGMYYLGINKIEGIGTEVNLTQGLEFLKKSADSGFPLAQAKYGYYLREGPIEIHNFIESAKYLEFAYKNHEIEGEYNFAVALYEGYGIKQDQDRAIQLLIDAAQNGNADAIYLYGKIVGKTDIQESQRCYKRAAKRGNLNACYKYGKILYRENHLDPLAIKYLRQCVDKKKFVDKIKAFIDKMEGIEYLKKLNQSVDPTQIAVLGDLYFKIIPEVALKYYVKSGIPRALMMQGICYYNGDGVPQNFEKAFTLFQAAVVKGDIYSSYFLGYMYMNGQGVEKDINNAITLFESATTFGHIQAQSYLGRYYFENGYKEQGIELLLLAATGNDRNAQYFLSQIYANIDEKQALQYLKKAADNLHPDAQYELARILEDRNDYVEAAKLYKLSAKNGNMYAQERFGCCLIIGSDIVPKNVEKGKKLLSESMKQGNENAQIIYAQVIENDYPYLSSRLYNATSIYPIVEKFEKFKYIPQLFKEQQRTLLLLERSLMNQTAFELLTQGCNLYKERKNDLKGALCFKLAAAKGDLDASFNYAVCNIEGRGIPKSQTNALYYLKKGAEKGHIPSKELYKKLYPKTIKEKADAGDIESIRKYAEMLYNGILIDKNDFEAAMYFKKAADKQDRIAANTYGIFLQDGIGVKQNFKLAFHYLTKSAELNFAPGISNLGSCYQFGIGCDRDLEKAISLYKKAASLGNSMGMVNYAMQIKNTNPREYLQYIKNAAAIGNAQAEFLYAQMLASGDRFCKQDTALSRQYFQKSADKGNPLAQTALGQLLMTEGETKSGALLIKTAADQKNPEACKLYASCCEAGFPELNKEEAKEYRKLAESCSY